MSVVAKVGLILLLLLPTRANAQTSSVVGAPFPRNTVVFGNGLIVFANYTKLNGCILTGMGGEIFNESNGAGSGKKIVALGWGQINICTGIILHQANAIFSMDHPLPDTLSVDCSSGLASASIMGTVILHDQIAGTDETAWVDFNWLATGPPEVEHDREVIAYLPWVGVLFQGIAVGRPAVATSLLITPTTILTSDDFAAGSINVDMLRFREQTLLLHLP